MARGELVCIRVRVLARLVETWDLPAEAGVPDGSALAADQDIPLV